MAYDSRLFTLHTTTRAGALEPAGREKLLHYVLRPRIAYERIERQPRGLVRITGGPELLKRKLDQDVLQCTC